MNKLPRILAVFQPQAWIDDYATDIDGRQEFDCTEAVLQLSLRDIQTLADDQYDTDELLPDEVRDDHNGPFYVTVEDQVTSFLAKNNAHPLTEDKLKELRKLYKVHATGTNSA